MLIKPIVDRIRALDYFREVKLSKDMPTLDDFKRDNIPLPIIFILPVKDSGTGLTSAFQPKQGVMSGYSFCLVTASGDDDCMKEPPLTEARLQLINGLAGFAITADYQPMEYEQGNILDTNSKVTLWAEGYKAQRNITPNAKNQ